MNQKSQKSKLHLLCIRYPSDVWIPWTNASDNTPFKSTQSCIGNGEKKISNELGGKSIIGGQNNTFDIQHEKYGDISIKDMTSDDCCLGSNGSQAIRTVFYSVIYPFITWIQKYRRSYRYIQKMYEKLNHCYGRSRTTVLHGIERFELSASNLTELHFIFENVKTFYQSLRNKSKSSSPFSSEYFQDWYKNIENTNLKHLLNKCVQQEAITNILIIVHKNYGWKIVKEIKNLICPRITRGSPRIHLLSS